MTRQHDEAADFGQLARIDFQRHAADEFSAALGHEIVGQQQRQFVDRPPQQALLPDLGLDQRCQRGHVGPAGGADDNRFGNGMRIIHEKASGYRVGLQAPGCRVKLVTIFFSCSL